MGATVVVETKSGTNQFHGSALRIPAQWRSGRHQLLLGRAAETAVSSESNSAALSGGPVLKNKLFFFRQRRSHAHRRGNHEPHHRADRRGARRQFRRPRHHLRPGDHRPGGRTGRAHARSPAIRSRPIDSTGRQQGDRALPASEPLPGNVSNYYFSAPQTNNTNEYDGRVDYNINDNQRIFGRYSRRDFNEASARNSAAPGRWSGFGKRWPCNRTPRWRIGVRFSPLPRRMSFVSAIRE